MNKFTKLIFYIEVDGERKEIIHFIQNPPGAMVLDIDWDIVEGGYDEGNN